MNQFNVVWICGMPRSGTSWLSQIIESSSSVTFKMAPLFSYAFKNKVNEFSSDEEWMTFFEEVLISKDDFLMQTERRKRGDFPSFKKNKEISHLAIKDVRNHQVIPKLLELDNCKVIYIVRNPNAAISSWLFSKKEFPAGADMMSEWKTGKCRKKAQGEYWGFNDWKKLTTQYLNLQNQYSNKLIVIKYEELVLQTKATVRKIFDFLDLDILNQTEDFLTESNKQHDTGDYSVFKDKFEVLNKWKLQLPGIIQEEIINELSGTALETFLKESENIGRK